MIIYNVTCLIHWCDIFDEVNDSYTSDDWDIIYLAIPTSDIIASWSWWWNKPGSVNVWPCETSSAPSMLWLEIWSCRWSCPIFPTDDSSAVVPHSNVQSDCSLSRSCSLFISWEENVASPWLSRLTLISSWPYWYADCFLLPESVSFVWRWSPVQVTSKRSDGLRCWLYVMVLLIAFFLKS